MTHQPAAIGSLIGIAAALIINPPIAWGITIIIGAIWAIAAHRGDTHT